MTYQMETTDTITGKSFDQLIAIPFMIDEASWLSTSKLKQIEIYISKSQLSINQRTLHDNN
jgi:hypothetical protein